MENLINAAVYVGTYAKYNNGSIFGKWMNLSDYSDSKAFYHACKELHRDEAEPEFMFQDYENIPKYLIAECWLSDNIFDMIKAISNFDETEQQAFTVWINHASWNIYSPNVSDLISWFEDEYQGYFRNEEDFAYDLIESCYDMDDFMKTYFDYDRFSRDLFICDYSYIDNFFFRIS